MKQSLPLFDAEGEGDAVLSDCGRYRYQLRRRVKGPSGRHGTVLFVCLNPSTADARLDDPTTRKLLGFTERWGFSDYTLCNLFAFRATDPAVLSIPDDPVGPDNDRVIAESFHGVDRIVFAWGSHPPVRSLIVARALAVSQAMMAVRTAPLPLCLGRCKDGAPRHPLMLAYTTPLEPYR